MYSLKINFCLHCLYCFKNVFVCIAKKKKKKKKKKTPCVIVVYRVVYIRKPDIGIMVSVFADIPGDLDSIPDQVIPKTQKKMVLDATLLNTQHCKVRIKGKVG